MANTYYKLLNGKIELEHKSRIIDGIQNDLKNSDELFFEKTFENKQSDINNLLRYYLLNQILKECPEITKQEKEDKQFTNTANPNIKKDKTDNKFHNFSTNPIPRSEEIVEVLEDGNYITIEKKFNSSYKIKRQYNNDDTLLFMQVIDSEDKIINEKWQVIQFLSLKKEVAETFKYSGFSGNSSDICAYILNKFNKPRETGYYMDGKFNFYSWNESKHAFFAKSNSEQTHPYLTDYDFKDDNVVIRKEYTGIR